MPPINHFTTKAKEAIRRAHELAIERGQSHVNSLHLLTALILQEEGIVTSILDKMEIDSILLTDSLIEAIEGSDAGQTLSASYQVYLTPDLAGVLEGSVKQTPILGDDFVSTEHLFLALIDVTSPAKDLLMKFKIQKDAVLRVIEEIRSVKTTNTDLPKKFKSLTKYTRNLTKLASMNKLDPVIGRDDEIGRIMQILSRRTKNNPILIGEAGV